MHTRTCTCERIRLPTRKHTPGQRLPAATWQAAATDLFTGRQSTASQQARQPPCPSKTVVRHMDRHTSSLDNQQTDQCRWSQKRCTETQPIPRPDSIQSNATINRHIDPDQPHPTRSPPPPNCHHNHPQPPATLPPITVVVVLTQTQTQEIYVACTHAKQTTSKKIIKNERNEREKRQRAVGNDNTTNDNRLRNKQSKTKKKKSQNEVT